METQIDVATVEAAGTELVEITFDAGGAPRVWRLTRNEAEELRYKLNKELYDTRGLRSAT